MCTQMRKGIAIGLSTLALSGGAPGFAAAASSATTQHEPSAGSAPALDALVVTPSPGVSQVAYRVTASGDNNDLPFMVIDKIAASVWIFDSKGTFLAATPALLGITVGDDSEPGVGDRELSEIPPEQRTTPAGRFVASFGRAEGERDVLWVEYHTGISLHAVVTRNRKERRLDRLKSPTPDDNRISYGCINVPADFYYHVVKTTFSAPQGIVYILPETRSLAEVFPTIFRQLPVSNATPSR